MSNETSRGVVKKTVLVLSVTIILYVLLGGLVNATGIRIYDSFPESFYVSESDPEQKLDCSVNNNAPITPYFINPFYIVQITFADPNNETYAYFMKEGNGKRNFTDSAIDLGRIDSGSSQSFSFYLHLGPHNVTFSINVLYSFFISFRVSSATYLIGYIGNQTYFIQKI